MPPPSASRPTPHGPTPHGPAPQEPAPHRSARARWRAVVAGVASAVGVLAAAGAVLVVLQPWRSCPDDDSPAACPVLARDHGLLGACLVVGLVAAVVLVLALTAPARDRRP